MPAKKDKAENPVTEDVSPTSNAPVLGFVASPDVIVTTEDVVTPTVEGVVAPEVVEDPVVDEDLPVRLTPEQVAEADTEEVADEAQEIVVTDDPVPEPAEPLDVVEENAQEIDDETPS